MTNSVSSSRFRSWDELTRRVPFAFVAAVLGFACSSEPSLRVKVRSSSDVNDQRSVYVLVRTVEESEFRLESYDEIAAKVLNPDDSVQDVAVVLPGSSLSFSLKLPPAKKRIAVYAMFERPLCGAWRVLLPEAAPHAELRLSDGRLCLVGEGGQCIVHGCGAELDSIAVTTLP